MGVVLRGDVLVFCVVVVTPLADSKKYRRRSYPHWIGLRTANLWRLHFDLYHLATTRQC
jgi:hypothetical protein